MYMWVGEERETHHAEIVAIIELTLARRTVMLPVTEGVHMLLGSLLGMKGTRAFVTFPHDDWNIRCCRWIILK